jgi:hypothetical protein
LAAIVETRVPKGAWCSEFFRKAGGPAPWLEKARRRFSQIFCAEKRFFFTLRRIWRIFMVILEKTPL